MNHSDPTVPVHDSSSHSIYARFLETLRLRPKAAQKTQRPRENLQRQREQAALIRRLYRIVKDLECITEELNRFSIGPGESPPDGMGQPIEGGRP